MVEGFTLRSRILLCAGGLLLALAPSAAAQGPDPVLPRPATDCPAEPASIEVGGSAAGAPLADDELAAPGEQPARLTAGARGAAGESAEYGIEYQLSREAATSWLDRAGSWLTGIVHEAMAWLGTPYRRGGASRRGIDCSALTGTVFARRGVDLPRTAAEQFRQGLPVAVGELRPGDLVFFRDTYKRGISHVGIYVGDGRFIHAAGRRQGVIVSDLARPYYQLRFAGARRVATPPSDSLAGLPSGSTASPGALRPTAIPTPRASSAGEEVAAVPAGDR